MRCKFVLPSFRGPGFGVGFRVSEVWRVTLFAYLDEFGHIGPYVGRDDPRYKESPVSGLAGFVLPAEGDRVIPFDIPATDPFESLPD